MKNKIFFDNLNIRLCSLKMNYQGCVFILCFPILRFTVFESPEWVVSPLGILCQVVFILESQCKCKIMSTAIKVVRIQQNIQQF